MLKLLRLIYLLVPAVFLQAADKQTITAYYMPLADHYAGILAKEWFGEDMQFADYQIERMPNWYMLRAAFLEGKADMAFIICPEALDMFSERPEFRWVGLLHRNGNTMIVNKQLAEAMQLDPDPVKRVPDDRLANAIRAGWESSDGAFHCGIPHPRATHTVAVYKYLKDNGLDLSIQKFAGKEVVLGEEVFPSRSLAYMRRQTNRNRMACTQQSLPWGNIISEQGDGQIAWYSEDVLKWPKGHVECIVIASDRAIKEKHPALEEVLEAIRKAGYRLEALRAGNDDSALQEVVPLIRKHIPDHTAAGIISALKSGGISYQHLELDNNAIGSLREIMNLAVEAGILEKPVDLKQFADRSFSQTGALMEPEK